MSFHATINAGTDQFGNTRHKVAPRVKVTDRRYTSQPLETGRDVRIIINGVADKYGTMGATTPVTAVYDIASPALGQKFKSAWARSIVTRGDWRKPSKGLWTIQTQMGMIKVSGGKVFLNGEYLGQVKMTTLNSKAGKDNLLTAIIAGTLTR